MHRSSAYSENGFSRGCLDFSKRDGARSRRSIMASHRDIETLLRVGSMTNFFSKSGLEPASTPHPFPSPYDLLKIMSNKQTSRDARRSDVGKKNFKGAGVIHIRRAGKEQTGTPVRATDGHLGPLPDDTVKIPEHDPPAPTW